MLLSKFLKRQIITSRIFKQILKRKLKRKYSVDASVKSVLKLQQLDICAEPPARGLVLGVYADLKDKNDTGYLTYMAKQYNVNKTSKRLHELLKISGPMPDIGETRLFFAVEDEKVPYYSAVAMVGLGEQCLGYCSHEVIDLQKEAIRRSVGCACVKLQQLRVARIDVDPCDHAESAAEGAALSVWAYQELRKPKNRLEIPLIDLYCIKGEPCDLEGWKMGLHKAGAQNITRQLQETPANLLTPTAFAQNVVEILCKSGINVEVKVEGWAESQRMNAFLAVSRASCETPIFLELSYFGTCSAEPPVVLVGQGITYDCGGLSLKKQHELKHMRGDMTGAACVVATMRAIANMRLPINIRGLIPLCENIMGCNAFRPGDTYKCMNGKTIEIDECDHEDVLVLADALIYSQNFCPKYIIDIGTTSGYMRNSLDEAACGIFTNSEILWQRIVNASMHTGDRVWRFPLWDYYSLNIKGGKNQQSDISNYGQEYNAGRPCKAAALLREFVPCGQWMHIDATNVMVTNGTDFEYIRKGMAGRPTRTIVEFLAQSVCNSLEAS